MQPTHTHTHFEDYRADSQTSAVIQAQKHLTCTPVITDYSHTRRSSERQTKTLSTTHHTTLACRVPLDVVVVLTSLECSHKTHSHLKWDTAVWLQWQVHFHKFNSESGWRTKHCSAFQIFSDGRSFLSNLMAKWSLLLPSTVEPLKPVHVESCPKVRNVNLFYPCNGLMTCPVFVTVCSP